MRVKTTKKVFNCTGMGTGYHGCGERITVGPNDIFAATESCISEESYWFYFRCPHCGEKTEILEEDISKKGKLIALGNLYR